MVTWRLALLLCLAFVAAVTTGFDLEEALGTEPTKSPTPAPKPNPGGDPTQAPAPKPTAGKDEFDLGDAVGPADNPKPAPKPKDDGSFAGGNDFGDADLADKLLPPDDHHDDQPTGDQTSGEEGQKQTVMAGILSAVGVAVVGAASSFFAYQKKKLCFKQQGDDPENVNMDGHKGADPQVQSSLLSQ